MAVLLPEGKQSFQTASGLPLVGGKLWTYDAGTSTPRPTYSDAAGTVPNTNPVILDARGEATVFWAGAYKVVLHDASDNVIWTIDGMATPEVSGASAALQTLLAGTASGKGASMVGLLGGGTVQQAVSAIAIKPTGGDDGAALSAASSAAEARGVSLILGEGAYTVSAALTLSSHIIVRHGAVITMSGAAAALGTTNSLWIDFAGGVDVGDYQYWLNGDWPIKFRKTDHVCAEWWDSAGILGVIEYNAGLSKYMAKDASTIVNRALRSLACATDTSTAYPDMQDVSNGCNVLQINGMYGVNNLIVWSGTKIYSKDLPGSVRGAGFQMRTYTSPLARVVPKNVSLTNACINNGTGQIEVKGLRLYGYNTSTLEAQPIFWYLSPYQAKIYLGLGADDTSVANAGVGSVDVLMRDNWYFGHGGAVHYCNRGQCYIDEYDCIHDVVRHAMWYDVSDNAATEKGSYGAYQSHGTYLYGMGGPGVYVTTDHDTQPVKIRLFAGQSKAGIAKSGVITAWRSAVYFKPTNYVKGSMLSIDGVQFERTDGLYGGVRIGGNVVVQNCQEFHNRGIYRDPCSANNQQAVNILSGVKRWTENGTYFFDNIDDTIVATARAISVTQTTQDLEYGVIAPKIVSYPYANDGTTTVSLATALYSDFALTGLSLLGIHVVGRVTTSIGSNFYGCSDYTVQGSGSAAFGTVAAGGISSAVSIAVPGARLGNRASASFPVDIGGCEYVAWVSASDTVKVRLSNPTASAIGIGTITVTAYAQK